jgi:hypothetical protein
MNNTGASYASGGVAPWPTTNDPDVLTSGQPFASVSPTIVDADIFEGNVGSFLAWQYFSRLYEYVP